VNMTARQRTLAGITLALLMITAFIGLLACIPVPIGDPERSRINDSMTGIWIGTDEDGLSVLVLEPYDKRTWLVGWYIVELQVEHDLEGYDSYEELIEITRTAEHVGTGVIFFKGWLKKIRGRLFMTWEPKAIFENFEDFEHELWFVWDVDLSQADQMTLRMVDHEFDGFDDVDQTRRAFESVIRRNVDNPELYVSDDEDLPGAYYRVQVDDVDMLQDVTTDATISPFE